MKSPQQPTPGNGIEAFRAAVARSEGNQFPPEVVDMVVGQNERLRVRVREGVAVAALESAGMTVVERAIAAGNVETMPDGTTAVTLPITKSSSYSVHPPVKTTRNRGKE